MLIVNSYSKIRIKGGSQWLILVIIVEQLLMTPDIYAIRLILHCIVITVVSIMYQRTMSAKGN